MLDVASFKTLLIPARFIVDLRINFVLNSTGHIQFYNIYTNNLLYNVCKIWLKAEQCKKKVRIKINKKIVKLRQIF